MPASGSAATSPRTMSCTDCGGAASAKPMSDRRASRRIVSLHSVEARPRLGRGAHQHERDLRAGRHVRLRAGRADLADEIDDPADLGLGRFVDESLERRPGGEGQDALPAPALPQLLGEERHEGVQELADDVEHMGGRGARLVAGRLVAALQHGLGELDVPVAEHGPRRSGRRRRPPR